LLHVIVFLSFDITSSIIQPQLFNQMKKATIGQLIAPTIICLIGIIIVTLISAFLFYFGDGPRLLKDFLVVFSPTIVLIMALLVSWRWQLVGGIIITTVGLGIAVIIPVLWSDKMGQYSSGMLRFEIIIGLIFIASGVLFLVSHFRKKASSG